MVLFLFQLLISHYKAARCQIAQNQLCEETQKRQQQSERAMQLASLNKSLEEQVTGRTNKLAEVNSALSDEKRDHSATRSSLVQLFVGLRYRT